MKPRHLSIVNKHGIYGCSLEMGAKGQFAVMGQFAKETALNHSDPCIISVISPSGRLQKNFTLLLCIDMMHTTVILQLTHWLTFISESPLSECVYTEKVEEVVISSLLAGGEGEKRKGQREKMR